MANSWLNGLLGGPYAGQRGGNWVNPWSNMTANQSYPYQRFGQYMNLYRYPQFPRAVFQDQYAETAATAAANNQAPPGTDPSRWQQSAQQPSSGTPSPSMPTTWGGLLGQGVTPQTSVGPATYGSGANQAAPTNQTAPQSENTSLRDAIVKMLGGQLGTSQKAMPASGQASAVQPKSGEDLYNRFQSIYSQNPMAGIAFWNQVAGTGAGMNNLPEVTKARMFSGNDDAYNNWRNTYHYNMLDSSAGNFDLATGKWTPGQAFNPDYVRERTGWNVPGAWQASNWSW